MRTAKAGGHAVDWGGISGTFYIYLYRYTVYILYTHIGEKYRGKIETIEKEEYNKRKIE